MKTIPALALVLISAVPLAGQRTITIPPGMAPDPRAPLPETGDWEISTDPNIARRTPDENISGAYGGWVQYRRVVTGPYGTTVEAATVFVRAGQAQCTGRMRMDAEVRNLVGSGIFHLTFKSWGDYIADAEPPSIEDRPHTAADVAEFRRLLRQQHRDEDGGYSFWVACPSEQERADNRNPFDTYFQDGGMSWDAGNSKAILPDKLEGGWTIPAPETDSRNGVTGSLSMAWKLCRGCYVKMNTVRNLPPSDRVNPPQL